jgi:hypothetical protein
MNRNDYHREYYSRNKDRLADARRERAEKTSFTTEQLKELVASRIQIDSNGCWIWQRAVSSHGYGSFIVAGKQFRAHRLSYEAHRGPIPKGLVLDHLCRVKQCCNPDHLQAVTQRENTLRGENFIAALAQATHCKHGHPLSGDNLYLHPNGGRDCRACRSRRSKESRLRRSIHA